jgi:hypothetical protein
MARTFRADREYQTDRNAETQRTAEIAEDRRETLLGFPLRSPCLSVVPGSELANEPDQD